LLSSPHGHSLLSPRQSTLTAGNRSRALLRLVLELAIVVAVVSLASANIYVRATWTEMEDGVLWGVEGGEVVAREVAPGTPAARAGVAPGFGFG